MAVRISNAAAIAACDAIVGGIDTGAGTANLVIYSGALPAEAETAIDAQVALVTFLLPNPAFAGAVDINPGAQAIANPIDAVQADETGTATFFRIYDADGATVLQGTVTNTEGNGDLKLSSTAIIADIDVTVVSLTATMPEAAA